MQKEWYIVPENIHLPKGFIQKLLDTITRKDFIYSCRLVALHQPLLGMGVFPIIHSLEMFLLRNREDGGSYIQSIYKFL